MSALGSQAVKKPAARGFRFRLDPWTAGSVVVAVLVALPIVTVLTMAMFPSENIWPHLLDTVLPGYVVNTLELMLGVALGTILIGVTTAWLITMCDFPGRRIFEWALVLPLAMPDYVVAYVSVSYTHLTLPTKRIV